MLAVCSREGGGGKKQRRENVIRMAFKLLRNSRRGNISLHMTCRLVPNALRLRTEWLACAAVLLLAGSAPGSAQVRPNLTLRYGIAVPDDAYQSNCGHSSLAFAVDAQGGGRIFPQLGVERHIGSGGGDVACLGTDGSRFTYTGGARLENSTRATLGVGGRLGDGRAQLEGVLRAGVLHARPGFQPRGANGKAAFTPLVGGQASAVVFHVAVLSFAMQWTRLSFETTPINGGPSTTRTDWAPLVTLQFGARLPIGPRPTTATSTVHRQ
jgi:hypothetical protein